MGYKSRLRWFFKIVPFVYYAQIAGSRFLESNMVFKKIRVPCRELARVGFGTGLVPWEAKR